MKINVQRDLCESNAFCCRVCPDVFAMDEDDNLVVVNENPGPELLDKVEHAINACPRNALSVDTSG